MKILTGDNDLVTRKVCQDVAMTITHLVTGPQLAALDDAGVRPGRSTRPTSSPASRPTQKEKVIQAPARAGPRRRASWATASTTRSALKAADVGISVDTAVDVAKESADIVLLEKSLLVLEDGIIEGRKVFGNIVKYISMGASSNFGNMFSVVGGELLPAVPAHGARSRCSSTTCSTTSRRSASPRTTWTRSTWPSRGRWNIENIRKFMIFIGPMSSIFDYATFFLMLYFFGCIALRRPGTPRPNEPYLRAALPHRLVRGVAAHPDAHRAHHPHAQDPLHPEPGQPAP